MPKQTTNSWSREKCRDRYVRGKAISFRRLSEQSHRHLSTIAEWSTEDPDGSWAVQRERYQNALTRETDTKAIEQVSDRLSSELAKLATEHFNIHKEVRELAMTYFRTRTQVLKAAKETDLVTLVTELKSLSASETNFWSLILTRHLEGERTATGLDYQFNLNTAAARLEKEGYVILDPKPQQPESNEKARE